MVQRQIAAEAAQRKHKEDELMLNDPETVAILKDQVQVRIVCPAHMCGRGSGSAAKWKIGPPTPQ